MPFRVTPPLPRTQRRNAVIQIKGPKDRKQLKRLNKELKKLLRKHGASYKTRTKKRAKKRR